VPIQKIQITVNVTIIIIIIIIIIVHYCTLLCIIVHYFALLRIITNVNKSQNSGIRQTGGNEVTANSSRPWGAHSSSNSPRVHGKRFPIKKIQYRGVMAERVRGGGGDQQAQARAFPAYNLRSPRGK